MRYVLENVQEEGRLCPTCSSFSLIYEAYSAPASIIHIMEGIDKIYDDILFDEEDSVYGRDNFEFSPFNANRKMGIVQNRD